MIHSPTNGQAALPESLSDRVRSLRLSEHSRQPQSFPMIPWLAVFVLSIACSGLGYLAFFKPANVEEDAATPTKKAATEAAASGTALVSINKDGKVLEAKGYIVAVDSVQVSPKVGAMVKEIYFKEGDYIKENQLLAVIDATMYQLDYDRSAAQAQSAFQKYQKLLKTTEADLQLAAAELAEANVRVEQAKADIDFNRTESKQVRTKSSNELATSLTKVEQMKNRLEKLQASLPIEALIAKAEFEFAEADRKRIKTNLEDTKVLAPISGTVLTKEASKGGMINATFAKDLPTSLCKIADLSNMEVDLPIAERDISRIFQGQKCKLYAEAFQERIYDGYVSRIMPIGDRGRTSVAVRVKIILRPDEKQGSFLRPDMSAVVTFFKDRSDKAE